MSKSEVSGRKLYSWNTYRVGVVCQDSPISTVVTVVDHFYILRYSPLSSRLTALLSHLILNEWLAFYSAFWISTQVVYLQRCLVVTWLAPRETAVFSARPLYTMQPCTTSRHFMQSHTRRVHACLAVTCHLHIWQNAWDLLRATAVTRGWNRYRNKTQHRKWPRRRKFSRPSCWDSNPRPFDHESGDLTTELSSRPSITQYDWACIGLRTKYHEAATQL